MKRRTQPAVYDVIIIGAGIMGCAAAHAIARRGYRTCVLEQFSVGHSFGSSHGPSRIIRLSYEDPLYIELARSAFRSWREIAAEAEVALLTRTGGLDLADAAHSQALQARAAAMDLAGVGFERLTASEVCRRYPQFALPGAAAALYQEATSILDCDSAVKTLADMARASGATFHSGKRAWAIRVERNATRVAADSYTYAASRVVVAAGAWTGKLLRPLGLELPLHVSREQVTVVAPQALADFDPGRFPIVIHHRDVGPLVSIFPVYGTAGVKLMFDHDGPEIDPDRLARDTNHGRARALRDYARVLLPGLTARIVATASCLYTDTPDRDFILDRHPEHPELVVLSACSGHGFKFAPVLGEAAADLVLDATRPLPSERFALSREGLRSELIGGTA